MSTQLQRIQDMLRAEVGEDFAEASNHRYNCRCAKCWQWWKDMGSDPDTGK